MLGIVFAGVTGGTLGAAYLWLLGVVRDLIGPPRWSSASQIVVLALVGLPVRLG